jgi:hypothetical protein
MLLNLRNHTSRPFLARLPRSYFVPNLQLGSFGAITPFTSLLKVRVLRVSQSVSQLASQSASHSFDQSVSQSVSQRASLLVIHSFSQSATQPVC